ncbi:hypothetical protein CPB83DRAFT_434534 [Crepidotus variabilis]|uniref:Uncharacterized protein n=1 Tax=Crepidotus variabilis TaxID=179855 RepID=A0A9P6EDA4_9AGAR|nr:hypothetical protein CPB83DRAFT_434534 [Crepidotus variabilis]
MPPRTKRGGNRANSGPKEEARSRTRIFVNEDGQSIYFFLHKNIRDSGQRRVLREDIEKHSGKVILDQDAADVILVNPVMDTKALDTLRFSYNASDDAYKRRMYFEKASFVRHCVREGKYHHRLPPIKGMGGYVGRRRTDFTSNDDDHLCKFIARTLPDKASGGRTGDSVYKALVENP